MDDHGQTTRIERDGAGLPVGIVAPSGQSTPLSVNPDGYLTSMANPAGHTVQLAYGTGGLLAQMKDPKGNPHNYFYDSQGRLVRDEDPAGGFKTLARMEDSTSYTVSFSTALGRTDTYRVERLATGGQQRVNTDPAGLKTITTYGTDGSTSTVSPDGMVVTLKEKGDPRFGLQAPMLDSLTIRTPGGLTLLSSMDRTLLLAQAGNPLSMTKQTDRLTVNGRIFTNTYDVSLKQFTSVSPEGRQQVTRIDGQGRVIEERISGIAPSTYAYDSQGQLSRMEQGGRTWSYGYDSRGRLASTTDPLDRTERYFYDDADRLERQVLPDGREIRYAYDAKGNLTSLTPPGRPAHSFSHTPVDLTERYAPPLLGGDSTATRYTYNQDRDLERITRPDGTAVEFGYDGAGRLSTLRTAAGQYTYTFDLGTGNLSSITAPGNATLSYSYDGSFPTAMQWAGEVVGSVGVSYNNDLQVAVQTVNGDSVRFAYDRDGLLTGAGALGLARLSQNGLVTGTALGGVTQRLSYNARGELSGDSVTFGTGTLFQTQYTRDDLGRITGLTETMGGQTSTYAFAYDSIGRLKEVKKDGSAVESYEYDANGNRTRFTSPNGLLTGSYDAQDRLIQYGSTTYGYTANGELRTKVAGSDTTYYEYDALGNLREVRLRGGTRIEYLIDGGNRRIGKKVNGARVQGFLYAGQLTPVAELDGNNQVVSRFVYATKGNIPDYMLKGGKTYRIISDHLGSVRQVADISTGEVVQRIDYDAYGRVTYNSNPGFQPFGYAGGLYDEHTELTRFGARDYDARTGRWTSKDPIGFAGGSSNLYAYALEDPVNLIDPDGLQATSIGWRIPPPPGFGDPSANPFQPGAEILGDWTDAAIDNARRNAEIAAAIGGAVCKSIMDRLRRWKGGIEALGGILNPPVFPSPTPQPPPPPPVEEQTQKAPKPIKPPVVDPGPGKGKKEP
jgi:RHS repeat-associated protein